MAIGWYSGEGLGRHVSGFVGITGLEELEARSEMRPTVKMHEDWERRNEGPCVTPIPSLKKNGAQFSCSVMSGSLRPHGLQHARPPCPSPAPGVYSNSCPLSQLMPSSHLILWRPLLLLPSIFPSIMVWKDPDSPSDKAAPFPALWFTMISRRKYHSCATVSWTPLKCF